MWGGVLQLTCVCEIVCFVLQYMCDLRVWVVSLYLCYTSVVFAWIACVYWLVDCDLWLTFVVVMWVRLLFWVQFSLCVCGWDGDFFNIYVCVQYICLFVSAYLFCMAEFGGVYCAHVCLCASMTLKAVNRSITILSKSEKYMVILGNMPELELNVYLTK